MFNYNSLFDFLLISLNFFSMHASEIINIVTIKEQRVDGNWQKDNTSCLRYTLIGFERGCFIKIPSYLLFTKRHYSTNNTTINLCDDKDIKGKSLSIDYAENNVSNNSNTLDPFFIAGFVDAEGSFMVSVRKATVYRQGWKVQAEFLITQHKRDIELLKKIRAYFGEIGSIDSRKGDVLQFRVFSIQQITDIVIPFFDKYPLITQKKADFELFKSAVNLMNSKRHLTEEGLLEIVNIIASMNKGLSQTLKEAFPASVPVTRPLIEGETQKILNPYWLAGFVTGEGCFYIKQRKSVHNQNIVELIFIIGQHSKDKALIQSFVFYLGVGRFSLSKKVAYYTCSKLSDNLSKILPFFQKYPILGIKSNDFNDWKKACEIVKAKDHLKEGGYNQIKLIKEGMNKGRLTR